MKESLSQQTANLKHKNNRHKRWKGIVSILACMVVFCTVYALILPALTAEGTPHCGKEEHTHTEDCYEKKLICGKEEGEGAHHHTDECYREEQVLVCTTPESDGHQHTDDCYTEEQVLTCTNTDPDHEHNEIDGCYTTERKLTCGKEEGEGAHHHTEECYETKRELICGQEENDGHKHTDDCYKKELVCGKEEHKHILACYSDPNADVEDGNVWQRTVSSVTLTGNWGADLAAIAKTQSGYTESTANYAVAEDGQTIHGYTRYGAWANDPYRDNWSAQFADFCLSYAGVPTSAVPQNSDCSAWNYTIPDGYTPKTGDLLLLDTDSNGSADHAGIVTSVSDSTLTAIVGDADKAVRNNTYNIGSETIKGYVSIPENPALATPTPEPTKEPEATPEAQPTQEPEATPEVTAEPTQEPENKTDDAADDKADENKTQDEDVKEDDAKKDDTANNIEVTPTPIPTPELAENQFAATLYTDSSYSTELENETPITVSGQLPVNAEIKAYPVENIIMENEEILYAWDISIFDENGNLWEPEEGNTISVEFQDPELKDNDTDYSIYYIPETGESKRPEKIDSQVTDAGISFTAEHFSIYALAKAQNAQANSIDFGQYITDSKMQKLQGDGWVDTDKFEDGDQVSIDISYAMKHGTVTNENRTITYKIPDGIKLNEKQTGIINGYIGSDHYENLGDYTITTDGEISITFNDTFLNEKGDFKGNIYFTGTASADKNSGTKKIKFGADGKTYTISPKPEENDLSVKKTAGEPNGSKIKYTVEVTSKNGTGTDSIKVSDKISYSGLDGITVGDITVVKNNDSSVSATTSNKKVEKNAVSFDIENLPPLGKNESYTITYEVDYGKVVGNGFASIGNEAKGYIGNSEKSKASTYKEIHKRMVEKSGKATDNNRNIEWTITVNPNRLTGVAGKYSLSDIMKLDGENEKKIDFSKVIGLKIEKKDVNWKTTDVTNDSSVFSNGVLKVEDGCSYQITYKTAVTPDVYKPSYTNSIEIRKGDDSYSDDATTSVTRPSAISKKNDGVIKVNDELARAEWTSNLNVYWIGSGSRITFIDRIMDKDGKVNPGVHYTTKSLLEESLKIKKDETVMSSEQYSVKYYDKDDNEVQDDSTPVVTFKITLQKPEDADYVYISYDTYMKIAGLDAGEKLTVKNESEVGDKKTEASADYTNTKRLFKYGGVKQSDGKLDYREKSSNVEYDATSNKLYYRIVVKPEDSKEFTVEDELPEGLTLDAQNVSVAFYTNNYTDLWYSEDNYDLKAGDKPAVEIITVDNKQKLKVTVKGGFPERFTKGDLGFCIDYVVDISDTFWEDLKNSNKTYKNVVNWNGKTETQETTVNRNTSVVSKDGEQLKDSLGKVTNKVKYYVTINPKNERLNDGKNLTLTDSLNTDKLSAELQMDTVKLYSYDKTKEHGKGAELPSSTFTFQYDNIHNTFTAVIPDQTPCVLEYEYVIDYGSQNGGEFSNSVELIGSDSNSDSSKITITKATSGGSVQKGAELIVVKVDSQRYQITLPKAEFKLSKWNLGWSELSDYTTGEDGTFSILDKDIDKDTLYALKETKAPDGYSISETDYYFVWLNTDTTADSWYSSHSNNLTDSNGTKINQSDIRFLKKSGMIIVPDRYSKLEVIKNWKDSDGNIISGPDSKNIEVQLYRQKTKLDSLSVRIITRGKSTKNENEIILTDVARGSSLKLKYDDWNAYNNMPNINYYETSIGSIYKGDTGGMVVIDVGKVTSDIVINVNKICNDGYLPEPTVEYSKSNDWIGSGDAETVGTPITLSSNTSWKGSWDNLSAEDENGNPYYYFVREVNPSEDYEVTYMNNNGIQTGQITITNQKKKSNDYVLPETGGIGTNRFTAVGLALMAGSLMCEYVMRRKRRERRGN